MKVLLDTNVLIAALVARGVCADLLEHCVLNHTLVTSEALLGELQDKLLSKFKFSKQDTDESVGLIRSQMTIVEPTPLETPVCRDPDDDVVLATGISGCADCLVTGDKDLLILKSIRAIPIVSTVGRPSKADRMSKRSGRPWKAVLQLLGSPREFPEFEPSAEE